VKIAEGGEVRFEGGEETVFDGEVWGVKMARDEWGEMETVQFREIGGKCLEVISTS
jgi:hypothetical protein